MAWVCEFYYLDPMEGLGGDMERDFIEKVGSGAIILSFLACVGMILLAPFLKVELEKYDQFITLLVGYLLKEMAQITVGRGGNGHNGGGRSGAGGGQRVGSEEDDEARAIRHLNKGGRS